MRGGTLMGRVVGNSKVMLVLPLLLVLIINLVDGNKEGQKLPRPNVIRGEILTLMGWDH